ncbi:hypothetical protein ACLB2K_032071 [Fragaria x ananassa]
MGIWDTISGTTDSLKRNAPDLTAVKGWCPKTDSLKRITPDGTAAKNVCSAAYGYGSSAVTKVDGTVRVNLIPYVRNEVAWSQIAQLGTIVAKNATYEAFKLVPAELEMAVVLECDITDAKLLRLEKELSEYKELNKPLADLKSPSVANIHSNARQKLEDMESESAYGSNIHSVGTRKPEDVILFIMKEFIFRQFCDDVMIPVAPRKRDNIK